MPPRKRTQLSEDMCIKARDTMYEIMTMDPDEARRYTQNLGAAAGLYRYCQTQDRYNLDQKTPEEYEVDAGYDGGHARQLAELTPEELAIYHKKLIQDGKKRRKPKDHEA